MHLLNQYSLLMVASNGRFDSVDLTSRNGEYSFLIGGIQHSLKPSAKSNKAGILQELR